MHRTLAIALLLLAACAAPGDPVAPTTTDAGTAPDDGTAPRPYSAAQIREAHPDGTLLRFRITQSGRTLVQNMRFEDGDEDAVTVVSWIEQPSGETVGSESLQHSRWTELRDHGAFAAARTTRTRSRCEVPAGTFECWQYAVQGTEPNAPVSHFHFADNMPGPPVLMVMERDGEVLMRMELLEHRRGS